MKYAYVFLGLIGAINATAVVYLIASHTELRREHRRQQEISDQDRVACEQARRLGMVHGRDQFLKSPKAKGPAPADLPPQLDPRADEAEVREVLERRQDIAWRSGVYVGWCEACEQRFHQEIAELPEIAA